MTGSRLYYAGFIEDLDATGFFRAVTQDVRAFGLRRTARLVARFGILPYLSSETKEYLKKLLRRNRSTWSASDPLLSSAISSILALRQDEQPDLSNKIKRKRHAYSAELLYSPYRAFFRESQNIFSSSFGIEVRDPLTSRHMVDFHFQTPEYIRKFGKNFRICHRLFMKGALPEQVRNRVDKAEFSVTTRHYLDRFGEDGCFSTEDFAASWLEQGEWHRLRQCAETSTGKVLWVVWGIFGCTLVASSIRNQDVGAAVGDMSATRQLR